MYFLKISNKFIAVMIFLILIKWDDGTSIAVSVTTRFSGPLARGNYPKVAVLEVESSRRHYDSTSFLKRILSP